MNVYAMDPSAVLDWQFDWSQWLASGETLTAGTVTAGSGLTVQSTSLTGTAVTAWLAHGTSGSQQDVSCHITTSAGRQDTRSILINIKNR